MSPLPTLSYTVRGGVYADRRFPHAAAAVCCMPLLLHAATYAACPAVLAAGCPVVLAAALLACSKLQQHWELAPNCAALYLNFRPTPEEPASCRGERRKTLREASPV